MRTFVDGEGCTWSYTHERGPFYLQSTPSGRPPTPLEAALLHITRGRWVVGADGKIWSVGERRCLGTQAVSGYIRISVKIDGKGFGVFVHRIVAMHHHGPFDRALTVHHRNHNKADNRPSNLQPMPRAENSRDGAQYRHRMSLDRRRGGRSAR